MDWTDVVHCASVSKDPELFYDRFVGFKEPLKDPRREHHVGDF